MAAGWDPWAPLSGSDRPGPRGTAVRRMDAAGVSTLLEAEQMVCSGSSSSGSTAQPRLSFGLSRNALASSPKYV